MKNLNHYIDHTLLKQDATMKEIKKLCDEAKQFDFMSVCVNPCYVPYAHELLKDSNVKVCTVIGFPLGQNLTSTKVQETIDCINHGADEIDMVINVGKLKDHDFDYVENEISQIRNVCHGKILKVILETCLLTDKEIVDACHLSLNAKADFVKTSTGFSKGGATIHAVKLMRDTVKDKMGVKASGGIHSYQDAINMINAGATRIGASSGVAIVSGTSKNE